MLGHPHANLILHAEHATLVRGAGRRLQPEQAVLRAHVRRRQRHPVLGRPER